MKLSELADLVTIVGVLAAIVSAAIAYRGWRHRTGHWLYIAAPNFTRQDPARPEFWVFQPQELEDGTFAVVIAGGLINAGPSDAFSVRVYVPSEMDWDEGFRPLRAAAKIASENEKTSYSPEEIWGGYVDNYHQSGPFVPVLRVGERLDFVLVSRLEKGNPYLEELLKGHDNPMVSCHWTTPEKEEAHGVHATSRTILGRKIVFTPADLCAPFENRRDGFSLRRPKPEGQI